MTFFKNLEFGSDFNLIADYPKGRSIADNLEQYRMFADGRQALESVLILEKIKRIFVPSYYCHESIQGVRELGVEICFYPCTPVADPTEATKNLQIRESDALLFMNHFGLHDIPSKQRSDCIVIEDHSHNLTGRWASNSVADWCFASLRKTLPIADGGILWSPARHKLPPDPKTDAEVSKTISNRYQAMAMKSRYLAGEKIEKSFYLNKFHLTENAFSDMPVSAIYYKSKKIVSELDIDAWNRIKYNNWSYLFNLFANTNDLFTVLNPDNQTDVPFSLIMEFADGQYRDKVRKKLIENNIFPAVLWKIPVNVDFASFDFCCRMLSVHCDARYTLDQIKVMANRMATILEKI